MSETADFCPTCKRVEPNQRISESGKLGSGNFKVIVQCLTCNNQYEIKERL